MSLSCVWSSVRESQPLGLRREQLQPAHPILIGLHSVGKVMNSGPNLLLLLVSGLHGGSQGRELAVQAVELLKEADAECRLE